MIEIIAIIRPNKIAQTKRALIEIDYPGFTCQRAMGRGKKPVDVVLPDNSVIKTKLLSKRLLIIIVPDEACEQVVNTIMRVNCTGQSGDGKIFVSKVEKSYSVRTGEKQFEK